MKCKLNFKNLFFIVLLLIGITACNDNDDSNRGELSQDLVATVERINRSVESVV